MESRRPTVLCDATQCACARKNRRMMHVCRYDAAGHEHGVFCEWRAGDLTARLSCRSRGLVSGMDAAGWMCATRTLYLSCWREASLGPATSRMPCAVSPDAVSLSAPTLTTSNLGAHLRFVPRRWMSPRSRGHTEWSYRPYHGNTASCEVRTPEAIGSSPPCDTLSTLLSRHQRMAPLKA